MNSATGTILVVDDEPVNRKILEDILKSAGYNVYQAADGAEALQYCAERDFDSVLLDVMMPNMTGYEVCQHLRATAQTQHLPILMITALAERQDRIKAMEVGANDFLTKPIDMQDILFRVRNTVRLKQLSDEVRENYLQLKKAEKSREEITAMMIHDMRNPLIGITGNLDIVQMDGRLEGEDAECIEQARRCALDLVNMVNSLLDISRLESGRMPIRPEDNDVTSILQVAIDSLGSRGRSARILTDLDGIPQVHCDSGIMSRVFANLISNAIDFIPPDFGQIRVRAVDEGEFLHVSVEDNGPGIPVEEQGKLFQKFSQTSNSRRNGRSSAGLGLAFCKMALESHGGTISLESAEGKGCIFHLFVPRAATMQMAA